MKVGQIYRENVIFKEKSPHNQDLNVPYSGYQTGNLYTCFICGSERMQGSKEDFRETAIVNQSLFESMPGNWTKFGKPAKVRPKQHQKKGKAA